MTVQPRDIIEFWRKAGPKAWFKKSAAFDAQIRERFEAVHHAAARGEHDDWAGSTADGIRWRSSSCSTSFRATSTVGRPTPSPPTPRRAPSPPGRHRRRATTWSRADPRLARVSTTCPSSIRKIRTSSGQAAPSHSARRLERESRRDAPDGPGSIATSSPASAAFRTATPAWAAGHRSRNRPSSDEGGFAGLIRGATRR